MKEEGEKSEEPEGAEDQQEGPLWKSGLVSREAEYEVDSIQDLVVGFGISVLSVIFISQYVVNNSSLDEHAGMGIA